MWAHAVHCLADECRWENWGAVSLVAFPRCLWSSHVWLYRAGHLKHGRGPSLALPRGPCSPSTEALPTRLLCLALLSLHQAHTRNTSWSQKAALPISNSQWPLNWPMFDSQHSIICKRLAHLLGKLLPQRCIPTIQGKNSHNVRELSSLLKQRIRKIDL